MIHTAPTAGRSATNMVIPRQRSSSFVHIAAPSARELFPEARIPLREVAVFCAICIAIAVYWFVSTAPTIPA